MQNGPENMEDRRQEANILAVREGKLVKTSVREVEGLYISDKGGGRHDPCVSP